MTIETWLRDGQAKLEAAGVATARLDCLVLLEDVLNTNRTQLLAELERELTDEQYAILCIVIEKRAQHIPLAYIRRKTEFYGREFYVDERVLEPRPESEIMIDLLKPICERLDLAQNVRGLTSHKIKLADVGSGSGALGITAKLECPGLDVTLLEIDSAALAVSRKNAKDYDIVAQTIKSDLLSGSDEHFDVLLCNLPYVPDDFHINTAATHEPKIAIFGGPDGLDLYRRLFEQIKVRADRPNYILTESLPPQHGILTQIAEAASYRQTAEDDFIQVFSLPLPS